MLSMVKVRGESLPPAARCATLKTGCKCALPLVLQGKSHSPWAFDLPKGVFQDLFIKLFKSLAPGRAAGGIFKLAASGGQGLSP